MKRQPIEGFSKLSKQEKINWIVKEYLDSNPYFTNILQQYWNDNSELQKLHDEFSENTISNFYMPYGIGGFKTTIINTEKLGHTHFILKADAVKIIHFFNFKLKKKLFEATESITANMRKRGGGILNI